MSIFDFTPKGYEKNERKTEILFDIETEIKKGTKYILIEAPTGIGKSWIAATIALWQKDAIILTPQKILQDQYEKDFGNNDGKYSSFMRICKGKSNFRCKQLDSGLDNGETYFPELSCTEGICNDNGVKCNYFCKKTDFSVKPGTEGTEKEEIEMVEPNSDICEYWKQRWEAEISSVSVYNYTMYLKTQLSQNDSDSGKNSTRYRKILICDEAEQLEDKLADELKLELSEDDAEIISNDNLKKEIHDITMDYDVTDVKDIVDRLIREYEYELKLQNKHNKCSRILSSNEHVNDHKFPKCPKHPKRRSKLCKGNCKKSFDFVNKGECFGCVEHTYDGLCKKDHIRFNQLEKKKIEENNIKLKDKLSEIEKDNKNFVISEINTEPNGAKTITIESIMISNIAQRLFDNFDHVICISSTLDDKIFRKDLGIYPHKTKFTKEFKIPKSKFRTNVETILQNEIPDDKFKKILKDANLFIKFSYQGKEFFAPQKVCIPNDSKPVLNVNGDLKVYRGTIDDIENAININRNFSNFYKWYKNPIPPNNRPIYKSAKVYLSEHNKEANFPCIIKQIEEILDYPDHKKEKGIIHVTSYDYQKMILEQISDKYLCRMECVVPYDKRPSKDILKKIGKFETKEALLDAHEKSKDPVVILSPSCWFGVDLKSDLGRFQIVTKYPKLPLENVKIKQKKQLTYGDDWYDMRTVYKLIQGCGRSIRNVEDHAKTYLLDKNCYEVEKNNKVRPWVLESIKEYTD